MTTPAKWLQVEFAVASSAVDAVAEALQDLGALAVSLGDPGGEPVLEPGPGATPLWENVIVTALLPAGRAEAAVRSRLGAVLGEPAPRLAFVAVEERDWVREFRENLRPLRFGPRLWICPVGQACPDAQGVSVTLEPGLAFGSGSHPTTAMCLEWLAGTDLSGRSVLDWGCGSGILAIAALALGARSVTALDIDPQALQATRDNARRNGRTEGLRLADPAGMPPGERHDVIVANILADSLVALAPVLRRHCAGGASVALSGILATQAGRVRDACAPWLDLGLAAELQGWVLLAGTPVNGATGHRDRNQHTAE
jgi:ribosomal protein L11 methyltransferase